MSGGYPTNMSEETKRVRSEKISRAVKKAMADPVRKELMREVARRTWERRGYKANFVMTDKIKEKIAATQRGKPKEWTKDKKKHDASLKKISKSGKKRFAEIGMDNHELFQPGVQERARIGSIKEMQTNPRRGKFETNVHAVDWHLRSPDGVEYHFMNLRHFIRTHSHMFDSQSLETPTADPGLTRVERCFHQLRPTNRRPTHCSKGWTWAEEKPTVTQVEDVI